VGSLLSALWHGRESLAGLRLSLLNLLLWLTLLLHLLRLPYLRLLGLCVRLILGPSRTCGQQNRHTKSCDNLGAKLEKHC